MFEVDAKYVHNISKGDVMTDYKELYLMMMRASEKAIKILIDAQRECEELYLKQNDDNDCEETVN